MDVQTIAERARLPVRKIRYVVDQRILPRMRRRVQKQLAGQPRDFTDMTGYHIACAACLLEAGVQRPVVVEMMARLADMPWPPAGRAEGRPSRTQRALPRPRTAIEALYHGPGADAAVLVGDGVNLRVRLRGIDTGWVEPRSGARLDESYRPVVVVYLNLAPLLEAFEVSSAQGTGSGG